MKLFLGHKKVLDNIECMEAWEINKFVIEHCAPIGVSEAARFRIRGKKEEMKRAKERWENSKEGWPGCIQILKEGPVLETDYRDIPIKLK